MVDELEGSIIRNSNSVIFFEGPLVVSSGPHQNDYTLSC